MREFDSTPRFQKPGPALLDSAIRAIPDILDEMDNENGEEVNNRAERVVNAANLVRRLEEAGLKKGAAHWAIHQLIQQDMLVATGVYFSGPGVVGRNGGWLMKPTVGRTIPNGDDFSTFVVRSTPALWDLCRPERSDTTSAETTDNTEGREMSNDATREYLVKVGSLKGMLNDRARNGSPSEQEYAKLRAELISIHPIRDALPNLVLRHRTIEEFWQFIKPKYATWRERTEFLQQEFEPILSWLEGGTTPAKSNSTGRASDVIKVLLLSANPIDSPLNIDEEFRAIDQKIRGSDHRDHVDLVKHGAVRLEDVAGLLMRHKPHVVHFSGHGATSGIALTGPDGKGRPVPPDALANIFRALKDNVRVVLLNACDSAPQAEAIVSEVDCAVGMSDEIEDEAAIAFAAAFYEVLGYGRSVQTAFDLALVQFEGAGADRSLATLHKRQTVKPSEIILVNPPRPQ